MDWNAFWDALPWDKLAAGMGTVAGALIGFISALVVARKTQAFTRKEFNRQQSLLLRLETAKAQESERQNELVEIGKLVAEVGKAAKTLTKLIKSSEIDVVKISADAFQNAGPFLKYVGELDSKWLLEPKENAQLKAVETALTTFFLALDFDGDRKPESDYIKKLDAAATALQKTVDTAQQTFRNSYLVKTVRRDA